MSAGRPLLSQKGPEVKRTALIVAVISICLVRPAAGERWLIERASGAQGLSAEDSWAPAAAELLLRRDLGRLRGLTILAKPDVKSDVATLELNRLSSAKGETRVLLGKFARAGGLIALDVARKPESEDLELTARVVDLTQPEREKALSETVKRSGDMEPAVARLAASAAEFLGRPAAADELARMGSPSFLTRDGLVALARGIEAREPAERELFLKQATMLSPRAPLAWHLYAQELHASAKTLDAISAYREAIKLDGEEARVHYDLANAFFDEKRYAEAAAEYGRAIALDPTHAASHENLVSALRMQKLAPEGVLGEYRKLAAPYEKVAVVHLEIGRLLAGTGKFAEAVEEFRRAGDLDPRDPVVRFDLAHTLEQSGKEDEAFYEYKEAIKLAPNYAKALNNVAALYEKKGKDRLALFYYQKAVEYAPDYALAWNNLGILYGRLGMNRLEMEAFRNQVKLTPKDPVAYYNLGVACHRSGQFKSAIDVYKKALELKPDDRPTHWQLAHAYEREGLWNLANGEWRKVLELAPTPEEKATAEKHLKENEGR